MSKNVSSFVSRLVRRKYIDFSRVTETKLARCLSTFDLTALGIGSTLGAGIYVVAGQVAREIAGPAVVLSFLVAALASVFAGLCYAEFGARVPKTGSAYVYSYVAVGELWAFVIGWNLILEYVIGTASVARAWSGYFDSLIDNRIGTFFATNMPMKMTGLAPYPDFFAFSITMFLTVVLSLGVKESSRFNNIFTGVNLLVVLYVIVCGLFKVDIKNWTIPPEDVPPSSDPRYENGEGGFFPFGFSGMMSGAATCFYAFVGFDVIATTGEEVQNPQKAIPIGIILSLTACFLAYFGLSAIVTLMTPYFMLHSKAPLPLVFESVGWGIAKYIIAIGAVCGLSTSLLGAMFPLPRVIYAMASDGLLFKFLARINERFKTPLIATFLSGLLAGIMTTVFDLKELVDMMSIGTLLAYTLVAICVLVLRYRPDPISYPQGDDQSPVNSDDLIVGSVELDTAEGAGPGKNTIINPNFREDAIGPDEIRSSDPIYNKPAQLSYTSHEIVYQLFLPSNIIATELSASIAGGCVAVLGFLIIAITAIMIFLMDNLMAHDGWVIAIIVLLSILFLLVFISLWRQPQNVRNLSFKVPFVPVLPVVSMFINIYLMLKLSSGTWIRFAVWMLIGFLIYFGYGMAHSEENKRYQADKKRRASIPEPTIVSNSSQAYLVKNNVSLAVDGITDNEIDIINHHRNSGSYNGDI
ncbi:high affinity cationic amino acid transporter 1-like [Tubulanus polymorphus]|uniref:high affinity cationic amino acid transporter 1-like n=1 Tax=Tubulanus polymorphus TaxID=672921 RepID=UPI003DA1DD2F